jgi:hypothetical protein
MIWLLYWAEILERFSQTVSWDYAPNRNAKSTRRAAPGGAHLRLVTVDGVLISNAMRRAG